LLVVIVIKMGGLTPPHFIVRSQEH